MYARRLITLNIMSEKMAELDARIKAAKEVLDEYEAKVSQDVLTDEEIQDRVTEIKKLRSVIQDIGSLTFTQRRRLVKRDVDEVTEEGFADLDRDRPQQNKKEHTNGTRH